MTDPKQEFDQLDGRFSRFYGKSSTDCSTTDLKTTIDRKTFESYTQFLEDEKDNIKNLVTEQAGEIAKNRSAAPAHRHLLKGAGGGAAPAPAPAITTEAFWWGFHIVFPEPTLKGLLAGQGVIATLTGAFAAVPAVAAVPPAAFLVAAAAAAFAIEGIAIAAVDNGNGVYLSWSWVQVPMLMACPALALPVPTPI